MRLPDRPGFRSTAAAAALSLLFLAAILVRWTARPPVTDLRIEIEADVPAPEIPVLRWDGKPIEPASVVRTGLRVRAVFDIPRVPPDKILLWLGESASDPDFIALRVRGPLGLPDYRLDEPRLRRLFHLRSRTDGRVKAAGRWLIPDEAFLKALAALHGDSRFYDLLAAALAALLFILLRGIDWRFFGLRPRVRVLAGGGAVFALLIGFPLAALILGIDAGIKVEEKRVLASVPEFRWTLPWNFLPHLSDAYDDNFPGRLSSITFYNRILLGGLGVSPNSQALVGKDGWLFSDGPGEFPGSTDYYRALDPLTAKDLEAWTRVLEERRDWLAARGIAYLFVVAPNANTIYPEYMPDRIRKASFRSRLDQLIDHLKANGFFNLVDLRPALRKAKSVEKVYFQTDTHWNDFGGYIAAREISIAAGRLIPGIRPLPFSRFHFDSTERKTGDLSLLVGLDQTGPWERVPVLAADPPFRFQKRWLSPRHLYTDCPGAALSGLVLCGDSFYEKLVPYLAEVTEHAHFIENGYATFFDEIINRERPRLVIDEQTERKLMSPVPENPPEIRSR